jgi:hypothetical protein
MKIHLATVLVIGIALIVSAFGYIFFSLNTKKIKGSRFWNSANYTQHHLLKMREGFLLQEKQSRAYKTIITLSVQCRNLVNKTMNEFVAIHRQRAENHDIRTVDLQLLKSFLTDISKLKVNLINSYNKLDNPDTRQPASYLKQVNECLWQMENIIAPVLSASSEQLNDNSLLEKLAGDAEKVYNNTIQIHEQCVANFRKFFAKA